MPDESRKPVEDIGRELPIWMLKALGKPEIAAGRFIVLLDESADQNKAVDIVNTALKEAGISASLLESF